jgi:hypothetical protein
VKIEFTLTYDEFLEPHQTRQGKTNRVLTSVVVAAYVLSAVACLIYGLWIAFTSPPDPIGGTKSRVMGFATAGLLLLMGIPYILQWRRRVDQRLSEQELREEFRQKWDGLREFEADNQGWSHRSTSGHDVRSWNTIRGFWNLKIVLMIATENGIYLLPKRAFEGDQLAELVTRIANIFRKESAECIFTADLKANAWDYMLGEASAERSFYTTSGLILLGVAMAISIALAVYLVLYRIGDDQGWDSLFLPGSVILLILWFFVAPLMTLSRNRLEAEFAPLMHVSIMVDGILLQTPNVFRLMKFDRMRKYRETRHALLFFYTDQYFEMLPKRGLEPKQLQTLRELITAKISS